MARIAIFAVLVLALPAWTEPGEGPLWFVGDTTATAQVVDGATDQRAAKDMDTCRQLVAARIYVSALNRSKVVVKDFQTSRQVEEALARLTEAYLALGIASEAQTVAAVLLRRFPNGHWAAEARAALQAAGLDPAEK
jgi:outer membrane protein assembly factor BamD